MCIQMAQLVGAEIFITAGSPSKMDFLEKTFGLPRCHILNSRTLNFGHELMRLTRGKGVDVIINWRCPSRKLEVLGYVWTIHRAR